MDIIYSNHAIAKIEILKRHGIEIDKTQIEEIVSDPEKLVRGTKTDQLLKEKLMKNTF